MKGQIQPPAPQGQGVFGRFVRPPAQPGHLARMNRGEPPQSIDHVFARWGSSPKPAPMTAPMQPDRRALLARALMRGVQP